MKFRGSLSAFVIVTGILISATSLAVRAATRCVNPGGTGGCSSSIQRAIDAAAPGDTILIGKGIYTENVVVTKPLTLLGAGDRREHRGWRARGDHPSPNPSDSGQARVRERTVSTTVRVRTMMSTMARESRGPQLFDPRFQTRIHARVIHCVAAWPAISFWSRPKMSRFEGSRWTGTIPT